MSQGGAVAQSVKRATPGEEVPGFSFADKDFPTQFKVMSQTQYSKSKTLQVWECRFIPLFVTTTVVS